MKDGRILVIDDSEVVLEKVKSVLSEAGYDVQTTTQTVGTARFLRGCDLVLLDFHMPGIDGASVLRSLQSAASSSGSCCAFYLFTSDTELAVRYASFGFDGAIRNKGDHTSLITQVRAALRMKKMREITRKRRPESVFPESVGALSRPGSAPVSPVTITETRSGGSAPPPPPSSRPTHPFSTPRRTSFPPPRPLGDQDDEPTADFPRTPT